MSATSKRGMSLAGGMLWAIASGAPAVADDTELFVFDSSVLAVNPNILFIFDTSGSMDTAVESQESYDPAVIYAGACADDRLYWRSAYDGEGRPPTCDTDRWIDAAALRCRAAGDAFGLDAGRLTDQFARYDALSESWQDLTQTDHDDVVECQDDRGSHGDGTDGDAVYASSGDPGEPWSASDTDEIAWQSYATLTLYDANYLNWYYGPTTQSTRSQVMKDVATSLIGSINGVNVGLMRFNDDQGGRLVHAIEEVSANRSALTAAIDALPASGYTPLSETMYEAAQYFLGGAPVYGTGDVGVAGGAYETPVEHACQKNYVVYLTDGEPTEDIDANERVPALPGFVDVVGSSCDGSGDGACLDDLAQYLYEGDLDLDLPGKQNVVTYTIGFTVDLPILAETAAAGGGRYHTADDTASLSQTLTNIVTSILETQTTFTSPAVSVNSFNRTHHLNDVFVSVFQPTGRVHWPGNLKKYRLRAADAEIVDADGRPAVDPDTGFFDEEGRSWWSEAPDGRDVERGGAASRLPHYDSRNVYTWLGGTSLTAGTNAVSTANAALTEALLEIGNPDDPPRDDVIAFMRGRDVTDANQDNSTTDARAQMGDPLHARPVSMVYGGSLAAPDADDAVVFVATNDGYLHAVDASTGVEKWAFVAPEFLGDQVRLMLDPAATAKHYGVDGALTLQTDADRDGVIDASSEKVYLYFGMRRGGTVYYGLDVTDPDAPGVLWRIDESDLPGVGQTWSAPIPTRMSIQGVERSVVVFGGGYDATQDNYAATTDERGNAIFIVDSETGALLWHGGASGGTEVFTDMQYSIPADVKVVDLDGDGLADRLYAADMGGQVWRLDVFNGNSAADLITGGVIARLGSAGLDAPTDADTRRFYYAPDVALATHGDGSFLHIGIGSGYRAHPNATGNQDRFYALRDYDTFNRLSQEEFATRTPVTEADLIDVTDDLDAVVPDGSAGWLFDLGSAEKVLAEARTFNNEVYFTTFTPGAAPSVSCEPRLGTNRLYVMSLFNGAPVTNLDGSVDEQQELTQTDRFREFSGSIASEVAFVFPSADDPENCVGDECAPAPIACVDLFCFPTNFGNNPIRTFWTQESIDR